MNGDDISNRGMAFMGLLDNQIFDVPIFVAVIGQETSDDQWDFLFSQLLHCDHKRVGLAVEFNQNWSVQATDSN